MNIVSIQLLNYRCFEDSGIIPLDSFSIFIGANDGGKSSVLLALYKLLSGQNFDDDDHRKVPSADGEEPETIEQMEIRLQLHDEEGIVYHYRHIRQIQPYGSSAKTTNEIEQNCVDDPKLNTDFESNTLDELKQLCSELALKPCGAANKKASYVEALTKYRSTLPSHKGWAPASKSFRDRLPSVFRYAEGSEMDPQTTIRNSLNDFYRNTILPSHKTHLETIRRSITENLNVEALKYVPVLQEHCQGVQEITVDLGDASLENIQIAAVRITQTGGAPIDWSRIGRGKRREMSLAVFRFHANLLKDTLESPNSESKNVVALFDEPDLNLDYGAQRRANATFQRLAKYSQCQVIVATHSINLIDNTPLQQICFFTGQSDSKTATSVERFDPSDDVAVMEILRDSMGLRNSAFFNEKLFVICEGITEMVALPALFGALTGKSISLCGIHLINGQNNEEARRIAKLLKKNQREVHLLLDNDCRQNSKFSDDKLKLDGLDPLKEVTFIGKTEFEDAFDDAVWLHVLNEHYPRLTGGKWTSDFIDDAHNSKKFSSMICTGVNECVKPATKPELIRHVVNTAITTSRIPVQMQDFVQHIFQRTEEESI